VLFDSAGVPKLSDFGAVALMESEWSGSHGERTLTLSFSGTPQYCCPEAWDGQPPTPLWDLYALSMVAREMLTGAAIRPLASPLAHIRQLLEAEEAPIQSLAPGLSDTFAALIDALGAREPAQRPESAADALRLLRNTPEYVQAAGADAHTLDLGRASLAGRPRRERKSRSWPERRRILRIAAPWLLLCVLGIVLAFDRFAVTAAPGPGEPATSTPRTAAPPRTPTQLERFQQALPGAEAIAGLTREPESGRSRVYALHSAGAPGELTHFIVRHDEAGDTVSATGLLNGQLHCLALAPGTDGGDWVLSGFSGDFSLGAVPVLRLSRVRGSAEWGGGLDQPIWFQLSYQSELAQEDWTDAVIAAPHVGPETDTAVILSWESHPALMPFLFRELAPRFPMPLAPNLALLPAVHGARVTADNTLPARDVSGAGSLADARALFGAAIAGRPLASGSWLAADRDPDTFRVAIGVPDGAAPVTSVELSVMPRYGVPLEDSAYLRVALAGEGWSAERVSGSVRAPVLSGWSAEVLEHADGCLIVVTMEAGALYWGGPPAPGAWHRLNAVVKQGAGEVAVRHEWGWPETGAVRHGALVELKF